MPEILIEVIIEEDKWAAVPLQDIVAPVGQALATELGLPEGLDCALLACSDERIALLNREFREKPNATNVLSWPAQELTPPEHPTLLELGDIALAYETCTKEAHVSQKTLEDHISHLVVHGLLHLLGYDHQNDAEADVMEALEAKVLCKLGIANPY